MKRAVFALLLALSVYCTPVFAEEMPADAGAAHNPVDQFTGKYWVDTSENGKEAYLFGIESAVAVEYFVSAKLAEKAARGGKKAPLTISPFEKGWMEAFKDTTRKEIAADVDKWFAAHPDQLDRPVLAVIWYDLIVPRLKASK